MMILNETFAINGTNDLSICKWAILNDFKTEYFHA